MYFNVYIHAMYLMEVSLQKRGVRIKTNVNKKIDKLRRHVYLHEREYIPNALWGVKQIGIAVAYISTYLLSIFFIFVLAIILFNDL